MARLPEIGKLLCDKDDEGVHYADETIEKWIQEKYDIFNPNEPTLKYLSENLKNKILATFKYGTENPYTDKKKQLPKEIFLMITEHLVKELSESASSTSKIISAQIQTEVEYKLRELYKIEVLSIEEAVREKALNTLSSDLSLIGKCKGIQKFILLKNYFVHHEIEIKRPDNTTSLWDPFGRKK